MKFQFLYLISPFVIYSATCQNLVERTNYTLSYFGNYNQNLINCKIDSDCPQFSKCENYNNTSFFCKFGNFYCPDEISDYFYSNESTTKPKCVFINTEMYNIDNNVLKEGVPENTKPIIKICNTFDIDKRNGCTTERCEKDSDCLMGKCIRNMCETDGFYSFYRCSSNYYLNDPHVICKKADNMRCYANEECYSNNCSNKDGATVRYCKASKGYSLKTYNTFIYLVIIIFSYLIFY